MSDSPANYHAIPTSEDHTDDHEADPRLTKAQAKWTYFLLGCAILLPWNALINATPFFLSRLDGSPFHPTFSSYLSSVYTLINLLSQFCSTVTSKQSSPSRRTFASIIGMILLLSSLCLSTFTRATPSIFFSFTLFGAVVSAVTSGYLCTAVYAGASLLGQSFLQTVLSGQAAVAVAVSSVQVVSSMISIAGSSPKYIPAGVTRAGGNDNHPEETAARIFFGVSVVFLGVTLVAYTWLTRQSFYKSATAPLERHREVGDADELDGLVADDCRITLTETKSRVYQVFERNFVFLFSIAYVFAVTLAVYPATTVRVRSMDPTTHPLLFTSVHFLVFNVGDLAGRYACSFPRLLVWSANKILSMALLRTLFIPLILLCNVDRSATAIPASSFISSDVLFMIILLAMGYTNGYVSTIATLAVASLEHNPRLKGRHEEVDIAATLGGFFVIVGLASGALSSFGVQAMV